MLSQWWATGRFVLVWVCESAWQFKRGMCVWLMVDGARSSQRRKVRSVVVGRGQVFLKGKVLEVVVGVSQGLIGASRNSCFEG